MNTGIYTAPFLVTPDYCGQDAALSPLGTFCIFQTLSAVHAEILGIGVQTMQQKKKFWVTAHNRVEFLGRAYLMESLSGDTWAEKCSPDSMKSFRSYQLQKGDRVIAKARTEWAILGADGKPLPFRESGFPADYEYADLPPAQPDPLWFEDDFTEADHCADYQVRSTDIDFGRHMNNVLYVRRLLDQFPAAKITSSSLRSIEVHYGTPCRENEALRFYSKQEGTTVRMVIRNAAGKAAVMAAIEFRD